MVNIIKNGGFESGSLAPGWRQTPGSAQFDGGVVAGQGYGGNYSLVMRGMDFVEQVLPFARADGDLMFYAKSESEIYAGPFYVRVVYLDGSETLEFISLSQNWKHYKIPVSKSKLISKIQFGTGETGAVYIDIVTLMGRRPDMSRYYIRKRYLKKFYGLPPYKIPKSL